MRPPPVELFPHAEYLLSAPGNLLLFGEYAVTEEGGLGLSLAPDIRAVLYCRLPGPHAGRRLRAIWPRGGFDWKEAGPEGDTIPAVLASVLRTLEARFGPPGPHAESWEICLNSSAFYDGTGKKTGIGSSAVSVLLLSTALLPVYGGPGFAIGNLGSEGFTAELGRIAVDAHRELQGGRGSGYDVLTSLVGGLCVFQGGKDPKIRRIQGGLGPFALRAGHQSVSTVSAIGAYEKLKAQEPETVSAYVGASNARVIDFEKTLDPAKRLTILGDAREAGIAFGEVLGVDAKLPSQPGGRESATLFAKAVGAGNETGIVLGEEKTLRKIHGDAALSRIAEEGLVSHPVESWRAGGKLLLFGEHSALYGFPAIGIGLGLSTVVRRIPDRDATFAKTLRETFAALRADGSASPIDQDISIDQDLLRRAEKAVAGFSFGELLLFSESEVPTIGGYGSSAALCVALARMILSASAQDSETDFEQRLWALATHLDSHFHGRASGIDTGLAMGRGLWSFEPGSPVDGPGGLRAPAFHRRRMRANFPLHIVYSGLARKSSTKESVAAIRSKMEARDPDTSARVAALGKIAESAIALFSDMDAGKVDLREDLEDHARTEQGLNSRSARIGALATKAQAELERLGLGHPDVGTLIAEGVAAGALGGKLSGGGCGGAFFLVSADADSAERVSRAIAEKALALGIRLDPSPRAENFGT